MSYKQLTQ